MKKMNALKTVLISAQGHIFKLSIVALTLVGITQAVNASLIDVNFYNAGYGGSTASGAGVVGTASDVWNGINATSSSGSAGPLVETGSSELVIFRVKATVGLA